MAIILTLYKHVSSVVQPADVHVPCRERVGGDLGEGEELVAIDRAGAILLER
jgi:hypothetical protein